MRQSKKHLVESSYMSITHSITSIVSQDCEKSKRLLAKTSRVKCWSTISCKYCSSRNPPLDSRDEMRECDSARLQNFLLWMLKEYKFKKISAITTYWRQLSQIYIVWERSRMNPKVMKNMFTICLFASRWLHAEQRAADMFDQFIESDLTREYKLDDLKKNKSTLDAQNFLKILRYHWLSDTNVFVSKLQRVQLAIILLTIAFTDFRFSTLLTIEYRDLNLFLLRNLISDLLIMMLRLTLIKIKSQMKRKRSWVLSSNDCCVKVWLSAASHTRLMWTTIRSFV